MLLRTKLHSQTYEFPDLRTLMGKANEEKSGDRLAGVAAETAAERVAARFVLAEVPLWVLREHPTMPYERDEVTRVIQDAVQETVYQEIKGWTVGALRQWLLADTTTSAMIHRIYRPDGRNDRRGHQTHVQPGLNLWRQKNPAHGPLC